jgi:hypothetical protein
MAKLDAWVSSVNCVYLIFFWIKKQLNLKQHYLIELFLLVENQQLKRLTHKITYKQ